MTVRERVLVSRLIEKIANNPEYGRKIGLNCEMVKTENKNHPNSADKWGNNCGEDNV